MTSELIERVAHAIYLRANPEGFKEWRHVDPKSMWLAYAQAALEASSQRIKELEAEVERLTGAIQRAVGVIEYGYRGVDKAELCPHERYGFEDCIACYDEALLAALQPKEQQS